jgi:SAM-dependent methyltransferase
MHARIDAQRVRELLAGSYCYYSKDSCIYETIGPLTPNSDQLLADTFADTFADTMTVLDVGCGDGRTLRRHASAFARGVGIDEDQDEIDAAKDAASAAGIRNLTFMRRFIRFKAQDGASDNALPFDASTFDLVLCERGPLAYCDNPLSEAMRVLKQGGLIFVETLGERNLMEVRAAFEPGFRMPGTYLCNLDSERLRFERHGVRIRTLASKVITFRFPDLYEWLRYQCSVWAYQGRPLPSPDDLRPFEQLVSLTGDDAGRISITYHPIWLAGSKPMPTTKKEDPQ